MSLHVRNVHHDLRHRHNADLLGNGPWYVPVKLLEVPGMHFEQAEAPAVSHRSMHSVTPVVAASVPL